MDLSKEILLYKIQTIKSNTLKSYNLAITKLDNIINNIDKLNQEHISNILEMIKKEIKNIWEKNIYETQNNI